MDEFGVLVESIGFKTQGKSAPMADLKSKINIGSGLRRPSGKASDFDAKSNSNSSYSSSSMNGPFVDDLDGIFRPNSNKTAQNFGGFDAFDDVFGAPISTSRMHESVRGGGNGSAFDLDSIFKGSKNSGGKSIVSDLYDDGDDIFGVLPGLKGSSSVKQDDAFGSVASPPRQSDSVDDLLGGFGEMMLKSNGSRRNSGSVEMNSDDFIPGFAGSSRSSNGSQRAKPESSHSPQSSGHSSKSTSTLVDDPFVVLESFSSLEKPGREHGVRKGAGESSIEELENFAMGNVQNDANNQAKAADQSDPFMHAGNDLESFFSTGSRPSMRTANEDPLLDTLFQKRGASEVQQTAYVSSSSMKKASPLSTKEVSSLRNFGDDFSTLFGESDPSSVEFHEIDGEGEERRRARLKQAMRTKARMAQALNDKNQRDRQTEWEQEERHRIAESLNNDIKRWAAGKEGNLRALLSSLHQILWPECGWQPVSLTDLITSTAVKKVYFKATLFVHPDKVQQKGASLQQKYTAEKVFDLLKEAKNKFNSEELR